MRTRLVAMGASAFAAYASLADGTASLSLSTNYIASVATSLTVTGVGLAKPSGVWVAWDDADQGVATNGWANVRFVGAVTPAAPSVDWPVPDGWGGDGKKALRFFLSEVPGDVDCTLTSIEATGGNTASPYLITDKKLTGAAKVELDCTLKDTSGTKGLFCSRGSSTSKNQFTLFALVGNRWRFDYNTKTGTNADYDKTAQPKEGTDYSIVASSAGLYVNNKKAQECSTGAWTGVCDGALTIFAYHGGNPTTPTGTSQMILRSFKVTDATFSLDLVPARKNGVVGALDLVSGAFIGPSGTGSFTPGDRVEAADPFLFATEVVGELPNIEGKLLFKTETEIVDSSAYADGIPGEKSGSGVLALSGANDFGGSFVVSGGTLLADFGAGLGANDNLKLTSGCFGATGGSITAALGTGPGEISLAGGAVGFTAATGDLAVNLGGEGADVVSQGVEPVLANPLILNDAHGTHTLTVANKIVVPGDLTLDVEAGRAVLTGGVDCQGRFGKTGGGELEVTDGAGIVATPAESSIARIYGRLTLHDGATFQAAHHIQLWGDASSVASLVVSNATVDLGDKWIYHNATDAEGNDAHARFLVYDGAKVTVGRVNISQGEMHLFGGEVTATDSDAGVALGSGYEAARLYGGTLETKSVRSTKSGAAFEFHGGRVRVHAASTSPFFKGSLAKTRVSSAGGAFDTNGFDRSITNSLVAVSGDKAVAYDRATAMTVPAFRKEGKGILGITAKISYKCATEVQGGKLKLGNATVGAVPCLPDDGLVRLTGGEIDVNHAVQTIGNLVGSGKIGGGGTLTVTGEIVPMAVDGVAAKIVVNTDDDTGHAPTKLVGKLVIPITAQGEVEAILASDDALDISDLDLVIEGAENLPESASLRIAEAGTRIEGSFRSVTGLPDGWRLTVGAKGISITNKGLRVIVR